MKLARYAGLMYSRIGVDIVTTRRCLLSKGFIQTDASSHSSVGLPDGDFRSHLLLKNVTSVARE